MKGVHVFNLKRSLPVVIGLLTVSLISACGGSNDKSASASNAGCKPKYTVKTHDAGALRVGAIQYPPYSTIKSGVAGGIDGEIMAGFAKAACLKMKAQETTFAAAVSSITSHRNDVA